MKLCGGSCQVKIDGLLWERYHRGKEVVRMAL